VLVGKNAYFFLFKKYNGKDVDLFEKITKVNILQLLLFIAEKRPVHIESLSCIAVGHRSFYQNSFVLQ